MKIAIPYATIIGPSGTLGEPFTKNDGVRLLRRIECFGRVSHASEDQQTDTSWERFIEFVVMTKGDWSIVEHASVSVDAVMDRGVSHEWVRHRLFSFTQSSTRFINYDKKIPPEFINPGGLSKDCSKAPNGEQVELSTEQLWGHAINTCESVYRELVRRSIPPQIARSVFPNALSTRIVTTGNLRQWRHFFLMRTSKEAHPQMREISLPLMAEFQDKIPLIFSDIVPLSKQSDNLKLPR